MTDNRTDTRKNNYMNKILRLFIMSLMVCISMTAKVYTPDNVPVATEFYDSIDFTAVSNPDKILSQAEVDSLNDMLWRLREIVGVQGLVVCVSETDPDDPYEFTMGVAKKYGVGGKSNTGFVVMLATVSRSYSILTGEGMEKYLTDALCSQIERHYMVPLLKEQKWGSALIAGVQKIEGVVTGDEATIEELMSAEDYEDDGSGMLGLLVFGGGIAGLIGLSRHQAKKKRKCPNCGKYHFGMARRNIEMPAAVMGENGKKILPRAKITDTYLCPDCQHQVDKVYNGNREDYKAGVYDGTKGDWGFSEMFLAAAAREAARRRRMSSSSSSRGSSRSSRSTFGGGRFGGGGASGRF